MRNDAEKLKAVAPWARYALDASQYYVLEANLTRYQSWISRVIAVCTPAVDDGGGGE
ncbi:MAG: hypothetical protein ACEQSX_12885 [Baekduiaceae bacterium]